MAENFGQTRTGRTPRPGRKPDPPNRVEGPENNQIADRPRRTPGGLLGEADEPTGTRGLLEAAEASLDELHKDIQRSLSGTPGDDRIVPPTERGDRRPPNDELNQGFKLQKLTPAPDEDEPPLVPGNPDDLGGRGLRRRRRDEGGASPVLRRGLLGV